jgi:hypothetical protein
VSKDEGKKDQRNKRAV